MTGMQQLVSLTPGCEAERGCEIRLSTMASTKKGRSRPMRLISEHMPQTLKRRLLRGIPEPVWQSLRPIVHGTTSVQRRLRQLRSRRALASLPLEIRGDRLPLAHRGSNWLAHPTFSFRSTEVIASHLALVADSLAAESVPFVVLDAEPNRRRLVVVSDRHASRARAALTQHLASEGVHFQTVGSGRRTRGGIFGHDEVPPEATRLRIFRVLATFDQVLLSAQELGCDLQFWHEIDEASVGPAGEPMPSGTWVAPTNNPWFQVIQPEQQKTVDREVDGLARPTLACVSAPHFESVRFPIDVVYTWVDGDDPEWLRRKTAALHGTSRTGELKPLAANRSRFSSRDELRYSMRSLDMYAGWVRHVYLVTDDQVPEWLDTSHPGLSVISHRELFGERGQLPTFNSHAIESQLHHIPGLAEHFLYLNDDVFFGRPVTPDRFVLSNGTSLFHLSRAKLDPGPVNPADWPVMAAGKLNRALISNRFQHQVTNKFKHVPHSLRRSVLAEIEATFDTEHAETARAQFRREGDIAIPSSLAHYYGYFTGRSAPGTIRYLYADIAETQTPDRLANLLRRRDVDIFCLNDTDSSQADHSRQTAMLEEFLSAYFPLPSSFELT